MEHRQDLSHEPPGRRPTFWQVLHSVLAAMFGVQSEKNRARDMTHGRPVDYIVVGLLATVVFVLLIAGIVQLVLHLAGR